MSDSSFLWASADDSRSSSADDCQTYMMQETVVNGHEPEHTELTPKASKKKHKKKREQDHEECKPQDIYSPNESEKEEKVFASPAPVHIKSDPDTEDSYVKKKSKKSHKSKKIKLEDSHSNDENFLETKVKKEKLELSAKQHLESQLEPEHEQEESEPVKVKKHKKKKKSFQSEDTDYEEKPKRKKHKKRIKENEERSEPSDHEEPPSPRADTPDSQTNHTSPKLYNSMLIQDDFSADETVIQTPKRAVERERSSLEEEVGEREAGALLQRHVRDSGREAGGASAGGGCDEDEELWLVAAPRGLQAPLSLDVERRRLRAAGGARLAGQPLRAARSVALLQAGAGDVTRLSVRALAGALAFHRAPAAPARAPPPGPAAERCGAAPVPLPATKLRHPLLGADYSAALRLPASVAAALASVPAAASPDHDDTHKHVKRKKKKRAAADADAPLENGSCEPDVAVPDDVPEVAPHDSEGVTKKKKKRKRESEAGDEVSPKKKKRKQGAVADVWDSAKEIEKSLFDF